MTQPVVFLSGSLWTSALCDIVLGQDIAGQGSLTGLSADRALFYADVLDLHRQPVQDNAAPAIRITADATLPEAVTLAAAGEIMSHFGRLAAQDLHWRRSMILSRAAASQIARTHPAPTSLRSATHGDQITTLALRTPHDGFFQTRSYDLRHPQYDGQTSPSLTREVFVATDAALVLPYDPARDHVLLVEQFRMGPFGRGDPYPWVLEPVAGRMDAGETPQETARRECLEEADLPLTALEHINTHYCSPGCSTEVFHCYLGLCDLPHEERSHGGLETEAEDIRRHVLPYDRVAELMRSGEINIGPLYMMLLWLERERPRLCASA